MRQRANGKDGELGRATGAGAIGAVRARARRGIGHASIVAVLACAGTAAAQGGEGAGPTKVILSAPVRPAETAPAAPAGTAPAAASPATPPPPAAANTPKPAGPANAAASGAPPAAVSGGASTQAGLTPGPVDKRDQAAYRLYVRQALAQYEKGRYAEAKQLFEQAHRAYPNARTLRGLGLVAYVQQDYATTIAYLESALASQVRPLDTTLAREAHAIVAHARALVGTVRVQVKPSHAQLKIGAAPVTLAADRTLTLNPGLHEIVAEADGYSASKRFVLVESGLVQDVAIELARSGAAAGANAATAAAPAANPPPLSPYQARPAPLEPAFPEYERSGSSAAPWVVVGVSAALAAGGGVLLGLALSDVASVEDAGPDTEWSEVEPAYSRSAGLSTAGIVMIGVGAVGVAAGLTWHFLEADEPETLALRVSPLAIDLNARF